jgi:hypothetical protein
MLSMTGRYDNPIWRTGPAGYKGWRNRFPEIDSWAHLTVYKYGLSVEPRYSRYYYCSTETIARDFF